MRADRRSPDPSSSPCWFPDAAAFRAWLETHGAEESELAVGFHAAGSGRAGLTRAQAVEEALCFGWVDGVRRRLDAQSYQIRFTPRRRGSTWSADDSEKAQELIRVGRMTAAGMRVYDQRAEKKSRTSSHEQEEEASLTAAEEAAFRAQPDAWGFFLRQPPSYRQKALWWVVGAKRDSTRATRLEKVVEASRTGRRLKALSG
jgi:uncharacterized protein YdeI (YjbR/CyaY-like superfamily)